MEILLVFVFLVVVFIFLNSKSKFTNLQKVHVVSFAHNCCRLAQENLERSAKQYGASNVYSLNLDTLDAPEYIKDQIKFNRRGAGYWVWKPFAMRQILKIAGPGDIVIYADASTYFNKSMENIIDFINKNGVLAFNHGFIDTLTGENHYQRNWTKMDAVRYFGYSSDWCENGGLKDQMIGGFVGIKNTQLGKEIITTWIDSMKEFNLYDDTQSILPNCEGFQESRHDQQMLSLILHKTGIQFPSYNKEVYGWVWHESSINGNNRHL